MRTVEVTLAGKVYAMPVDFEASMRLHEKGVDPLKLSSTLASNEGMTLVQVLSIIIAGVRGAGCQLPDKAIGDEIIERGPHDFMLPAAKYVVALVSGAPKVPVGDTKKNDEQTPSESRAA
jgi:hypothetical protein